MAEESDEEDGRRRESPLGVRRRVKAVLRRAKDRTGVNNNSDMSEDSSITKSLYNTIAGVEDSIKVNGETTKNGVAPPKTNGAAATTNKPASFSAASSSETNVESSSASTQPKLKPLPFDLPNLSEAQMAQLLAGERIQEQSKMGREGSGYVVVDVKAPPYVVWECLLDFESYPTTIPTVRGVSLFTSENLKSGYHAEKPIIPGSGRELRHYGTPSTTRAAFTLSKFRLNIAAIHKYRPHPDGDYMLFTLDPECTNAVLQSATGIWHTQANPEGRGEEYTRVWLLCGLKVSPVLPRFIVDYAARRAMPRASTWLKPQVEAAARLWLKNTPLDIASNGAN